MSKTQNMVDLAQFGGGQVMCHNIHETQPLFLMGMSTGKLIEYNWVTKKAKEIDRGDFSRNVITAVSYLGDDVIFGSRTGRLDLVNCTKRQCVIDPRELVVGPLTFIKVIKDRIYVAGGDDLARMPIKALVRFNEEMGDPKVKEDYIYKTSYDTISTKGENPDVMEIFEDKAEVYVVGKEVLFKHHLDDMQVRTREQTGRTIAAVQNKVGNVITVEKDSVKLWHQGTQVTRSLGVANCKSAFYDSDIDKLMLTTGSFLGSEQHVITGDNLKCEKRSTALKKDQNMRVLYQPATGYAFKFEEEAGSVRVGASMPWIKQTSRQVELF